MCSRSCWCCWCGGACSRLILRAQMLMCLSPLECVMVRLMTLEHFDHFLKHGNQNSGSASSLNRRFKQGFPMIEDPLYYIYFQFIAPGLPANFPYCYSPLTSSMSVRDYVRKCTSVHLQTHCLIIRWQVLVFDRLINVCEPSGYLMQQTWTLRKSTPQVINVLFMGDQS